MQEQRVTFLTLYRLTLKVFKNQTKTIMKHLLLATICICMLSFFQPWKKVKGSGNLKKETREISGFTAIKLSGTPNVEIAYGSGNTISVEADDNLLEYIETKVENGALIVKSKDNLNLKSDHRIIVYVNMETITGLRVSGSGNIIGKGGFSNDGETELSVTGSGNINLSAGSFRSTNARLSGSGNLVLSGDKTTALEATISGSGNIDASNFKTETANAQISGSGNIRVNVSKSLDARVSGSGNVFYKGDAADVKTKKSGSGKVIKM